MPKKLLIFLIIFMVCIFLAEFYFRKESWPLFLVIGAPIGTIVGATVTINTKSYMEQRIISGITALAIIGGFYVLFWCLKLDKYYFDFNSLNIKTEEEVNREYFNRIQTNINSQMKNQ